MFLLKTLRVGAGYMALWPDEPLLGAVFPEMRVRYVMRVGRRVLPPCMVLVIAWAFIRGGGLHPGVSPWLALRQDWQVTALCLLFLLSLPLQGYYWFGQRAVTPLNPKLKLFYCHTCTALRRPGVESPVMRDLVLVIRDGINTLGRDFLRQL